MAIEQLDNDPRCQHVHLSGRPCKAPARRGGPWCLFHAAEHNEAPVHFTALDDAAGIHAAVGQILGSLQRDTIDLRRASLMFSGLRIARANLKQLGLELGDDVAPAARKSKQDPDEVPGPSLAEILLERLDLHEPGDAEAIAKAKAEGGLAELLIERLDLVDEPPAEDTPAETDEPGCGQPGSEK